MESIRSIACTNFLFCLIQLEPATDPSVPAQVTTSEQGATEASREVEFVIATPPQSPTNDVKQMPPDHEMNTTDSSVLLKGNVQPAVDSSGVSSTEQRMSPAGQSTMVISTPPTKYWSDEVKDKMTAVCDPNAGLPEHYRTELVRLRRKIERLEQERAHKEDEHSADIKHYKLKCENMMKQKSLLERQLSESEQNEKCLEKRLCESEKDNETLIKQLASANEKISEYERKIQEKSFKRDRVLQQCDDQFVKENHLFLKTVSETIENVHDARHVADLKWLQTKAKITIDKSKSCPSFKNLTL